MTPLRLITIAAAAISLFTNPASAQGGRVISGVAEFFADLFNAGPRAARSVRPNLRLSPRAGAGRGIAMISEIAPRFLQRGGSLVAGLDSVGSGALLKYIEARPALARLDLLKWRLSNPPSNLSEALDFLTAMSSRSPRRDIELSLFLDRDVFHAPRESILKAWGERPRAEFPPANQVDAYLASMRGRQVLLVGHVEKDALVMRNLAGDVTSRYNIRSLTARAERENVLLVFVGCRSGPGGSAIGFVDNVSTDAVASLLGSMPRAPETLGDLVAGLRGAGEVFVDTDHLSRYLEIIVRPNAAELPSVRFHLLKRAWAQLPSAIARHRPQDQVRLPARRLIADDFTEVVGELTRPATWSDMDASPQKINLHVMDYGHEKDDPPLSLRDHIEDTWFGELVLERLSLIAVLSLVATVILGIITHLLRTPFFFRSPARLFVRTPTLCICFALVPFQLLLATTVSALSLIEESVLLMTFGFGQAIIGWQLFGALRRRDLDSRITPQSINESRAEALSDSAAWVSKR